VDLQATDWVVDLGARFVAGPTTAAAIVSRLGYAPCSSSCCS
jgi:NaMN:DMB phosphoribosyltransferase